MLWWLLQFARRCTRRHMLDAARHQQGILESSRREYASLVAAGAFDGEWRDHGLLYVLRTRKGMDAFARMDAMLRDEFGGRGPGASKASSFRGWTRRSGPVSPGRFTTRGTRLFGPDALVRDWAAALRSRGVRFEENRRLTGVHVRSGECGHRRNGPRRLERRSTRDRHRCLDWTALLGVRAVIAA